MAAERRIHDEPLYVVCGEHSIRYPAVEHSCPNCEGGNSGHKTNKHHDNPMPVIITQSDL